MRTFEPGLEDELGGDRIEQWFGGSAVATGFAQACFGIDRGHALVGKTDRQVVTTFQALGKLGGESRHFVGRAIRVGGQADNQLFRLPFGNQLGDGGKTVIVRFGMDGGQRMRRAKQRFACRDADTLFTEIKGQDSAHQRCDPLMRGRPHRKAG